MYRTIIGIERMNRIQMVKDWDQWRAFENTTSICGFLKPRVTVAFKVKRVFILFIAFDRSTNLFVDNKKKISKKLDKLDLLSVMGHLQSTKNILRTTILRDN